MIDLARSEPGVDNSTVKRLSPPADSPSEMLSLKSNITVA